MIKKLALFSLIVLFAANSFIASAWAAQCISPDTQSTSYTIASADMPCHENMKSDQNKKSGTHCDGLCLCLHASISSALSLPNDSAIAKDLFSYKPMIEKQIHLYSRSTSPPLRPPITLS